MPRWHLPANAGQVRECVVNGVVGVGEWHELPTLREAAARYVADGRRSPVAPVGEVAAVVDHVREGFGRWVARSGWASSGSVACGVDSCPNLIVDPTRCAGLFVFTPGLDVVGICERCARVASGDVAAAPGCFAAVSSLYVFGSETDGRGERSGGAE